MYKKEREKEKENKRRNERRVGISKGERSNFGESAIFLTQTQECRLLRSYCQASQPQPGYTGAYHRLHSLRAAPALNSQKMQQVSERTLDARGVDMQAA